MLAYQGIDMLLGYLASIIAFVAPPFLSTYWAISAFIKDKSLAILGSIVITEITFLSIFHVRNYFITIYFALVIILGIIGVIGRLGYNRLKAFIYKVKGEYAKNNKE